MVHNYDFTGVDIRPSDEDINSFISKYPYVFPVRKTYRDNGKTYFEVVGSDQPLTMIEDTENYVCRVQAGSKDGGGMVYVLGEITWGLPNIFSVSTRSYTGVTTRIGTPNTANILYPLSKTHNYRLDGVTRPSDDTINNFISKYTYIVPVKFTENGVTHLRIIGSNDVLTLTGDNENTICNVNRKLRSKYFTLESDGREVEQAGSVLGVSATAEGVTTKIGEPNTAGIYYPSYVGLIFSDAVGEELSTDGGLTLKTLDVGEIIKGGQSEVVPITLKNTNKFSVKDVSLEVISDNLSNKGKILFSKGYDPPRPLNKIVYGVELQSNEELTFYLRVKVHPNATAGETNFMIRASAKPVN